ncbi:uncharacterized protein LOC134776313 isoform X2 [Penaeus indicus]|uniref:uncharacterized protein LOC134776313 isoform X2 n=1 Tax=Penaeus indicus TaxID=29960 RepID=UPI00300C4B99
MVFFTLGVWSSSWPHTTSKLWTWTLDFLVMGSPKFTVSSKDNSQDLFKDQKRVIQNVGINTRDFRVDLVGWSDYVNTARLHLRYFAFRLYVKKKMYAEGSLL